MDNINFPFNQPATSDLYDVLSPLILNNNPPTSINSWQTNFFGSFLGQYSLNSPNAGNFYTTIGVPDLAYQLTNNQNKPIVVLPDPEYLPKSLNSTNPVYGYTWNSSTNSISEIIITDVNQYYDLIEDGNYFVIALSYNTDEIEAKDVYFNCTEQWQPNDGYCDGNCGENSINSPNDCNQQTNRKKLYLRKFRINDDFKDRNSISPHEKRHWESLLAGQYEPSVGCLIIHNNQKATAIQKISLNKVSNDLVKRSKRKRNGTIISSGTSMFVDASEIGSSSTNQAVLIGDNLNPNTDKIFIYFSEKTRNKTNNVPIMFNGNNLFNATIMNTCMSSGKLANDFQGFTAAQNYTWYSFVSNNFPTPWISETMTHNGKTENIRVLYRHLNRQNDVDFEIYYLENKYEW